MNIINKIIRKLFTQQSEIKKYRNLGVKIGSNCNFYSVFIDRCFSHLITIGNNVTITHSTLIAHDASTKRPLGYSKVGKITIGDDVFIGHGSIILGNTSIGNKVIIGAGSVVCKNIPENSVACGNPIRIICTYDEYIKKNKGEQSTAAYENFGFNGKLPQYFENETYKEILCARDFFLNRFSKISSEEAMVFSAFLHVLHGNRPYALSRHSHPLTPYAPTGEFEYKSVIEKIVQKVDANYKKLGQTEVTQGFAIYGDYKDLETKDIVADFIICSPPFADSIRFYMQNWMRLWLCGWEPGDYKEADAKFLDKAQKKNFDLYYSFFEMCHNVLNENGKVILHLGRTESVNMGIELSKRAEPWFDTVYLAGEDVSKIEKYGIKDKGATVEHQYLFLQKK